MAVVPGSLMAAESVVQRSVWMSLAQRVRAKVTLFRSNSGKAWMSNLGPKGIQRLTNGSIVMQSPRPVGLGLCLVNGDTVPGLSDLTGWTDVVITPEMVGRHIPVFTLIETKESGGGRKQANQINCVRQVQAAGGIAGFAASEKQANEIIDAWRRGGAFCLRARAVSYRLKKALAVLPPRSPPTFY